MPNELDLYTEVLPDDFSMPVADLCWLAVKKSVPHFKGVTYPKDDDFALSDHNDAESVPHAVMLRMGQLRDVLCGRCEDITGDVVVVRVGGTVKIYCSSKDKDMEIPNRFAAQGSIPGPTAVMLAMACMAAMTYEGMADFLEKIEEMTSGRDDISFNSGVLLTALNLMTEEDFAAARDDEITPPLVKKMQDHQRMLAIAYVEKELGSEMARKFAGG